MKEHCNEESSNQFYPNKCQLPNADVPILGSPGPGKKFYTIEPTPGLNNHLFFDGNKPRSSMPSDIHYHK